PNWRRAAGVRAGAQDRGRAAPDRSLLRRASARKEATSPRRARAGQEERLMLAKQVQTLAAYNRWMNDKLYVACAELSDAERKADRKAFFKSTHGPLTHILLAARVCFGRFIGKPVKFKSLDEELYADFADLRA